MTDPSASSRTSSLAERMVGAEFLSVDTFEEVEHDQNATGQAAFVVAIVAVARGIGVSGSGMDIRIRSDPGLAAVRVAPSLGRSRGVHRGSSGARYRQYQDHADDLGGPRCERFPRAPLLT
jgi:hypothetical protein